ncbi:MAG: glycosyltransferase family 9 protein [Candidatus Marinimicrobia bacterium]|nr:glycosyltransferase family 9 protein [Candidatus Neomarinimicrobiota bacterium]
MPITSILILLRFLYDRSFDMIFDFHGDIRRIRMMKKLRSRYRCGFRFSGGAAWLTHVVDYPYHQHQAERPFALLRELNIPTEPRSPRLKGFPQKTRHSCGILLHPGANHTGRLWPEEHWKQLIALLQKEKHALAWISPRTNGSGRHSGNKGQFDGHCPAYKRSGPSDWL